MGDNKRIDAVYARGSSVEKDDSVSIEDQLALCRLEVDASSAREYVDDGYSAKNVDRPQLQQMMKDIEAGQIARVVVYGLTRFSRTVADFAKIMDVCQKHDVAFVSLTEKFDSTTPLGRALLNMSVVFLQLETEYKKAMKR